MMNVVSGPPREDSIPGSTSNTRSSVSEYLPHKMLAGSSINAENQQVAMNLALGICVADTAEV